MSEPPHWRASRMKRLEAAAIAAAGDAAEEAGIVDQDAPATDALAEAGLAETGDTPDDPAADDETEEK